MNGKQKRLGHRMEEWVFGSTGPTELDGFEESVLPHIEKGHSIVCVYSQTDPDSGTRLLCETCNLELVVLHGEVFSFVLGFLSQQSNSIRVSDVSTQ
jgi:hypothetical protein